MVDGGELMPWRSEHARDDEGMKKRPVPTLILGRQNKTDTKTQTVH
jgi:hypothetical protein